MTTAPTSLPPRKERIAREKREKKAQTILTVKQTLQEKKPTLDTFVQTDKLKEVGTSLVEKAKGILKSKKQQTEEVKHSQSEISAATPLRAEEAVPSAVVEPLEIAEEKEIVETPTSSIIPLPVHTKAEPVTIEETTTHPTAVVSAEEEEANEPATREERRRNKFTFKVYHGVLFVFFGGLLCYWWILS